LAGLIALVNEQNNKPSGYIHPVIYNNQKLYRDIVTGDNITTTTKLGYKAGKGWDACTGLGVLFNYVADNTQA
jgi:kumamolisin